MAMLPFINAQNVVNIPAITMAFSESDRMDAILDENVSIVALNDVKMVKESS